MNPPTEIELNEFVRLFFEKPEPWVLWLGSAVSIELPSAVPGAEAILQALIEELGQGVEPGVPEAQAMLAEAQTLLGTGGPLGLRNRDRDVPFEVALGQISDHTDSFVATYLEQITPRSASPNPNHIAAAALALGTLSTPARVRLLVTTNFDECIESAASARLPVSVPKEGSFPAPSSPALVKLHGTISDGDSLGTTPQALARRDSDEWRSSLVENLGTSNVLVVGYSFSDTFDITPALVAAEANGARFYWACRTGDDPRALRVPVHAVVRHDLQSADRSILRKLVPASASGAPAPVWPDQMDIARRGCSDVETQLHLPVAMKLAAFASLFYWIEKGERSLRYFIASYRCPGSRVDRHILATANSRARRFRAAVRWFDLMLRLDLPRGEPERTKREIDWRVGAGFCASAGGRPMSAARSYRLARAAFNKAKRDGILGERDLGPYLADQLLRSQAAQEIRVARWHQGHRDRHLANATRYLDCLEAIGGLELATRPLLPLERARLKLALGQPNAAIVFIEKAEERIDPLRDPHALTVCRRLKAIASHDRRSQSALAAEAWREGRRIEWAKIQAERWGFDGYGRGATLIYAARCLLLATWDLAKEFVRPPRPAH